MSDANRGSAGIDTGRRQFLKQTVFGVLALSASRFFPLSDSGIHLSPDIGSQLVYFSPKEYAIVSAVADRV
ncbi:MAG TPA: hypothetical protein VI758_05165, partial [Bacteroidota bacterium]